MSYSNLIKELGFSKSLPEEENDAGGLDASPVDQGDLEDADDDRDLVAVLGMLRKMSGVVVAQGRAISAMRAELDAIKGPTGSPMTKGQAPEALSGEQFMAKALIAQVENRINGRQVAIAEAHINAGKQPPAEIVAAVIGEDV